MPHALASIEKQASNHDPLFSQIFLNRRLFGALPYSTSPTDLFYNFVNKYMSSCNEYTASNTASNSASNTAKEPTESKNKYAIVVVDNRPNIMNVIAMDATRRVLSTSSGYQWDTVVFTRADETDQKFYSDRVPGAIIVPLADMPQQKRFNMCFYNQLLKSEAFWEKLSCYQRVLLIQDDGFLVRNGDIDSFLRFDYVGAPWDPSVDFNKYMHQNPRFNMSPNFVGNGGLSLRNPNAMLEMIRISGANVRALHHDGLQPEPEDVFFSKMCLRHNKAMPTLDEAKTFASEEIICSASLGFHKVWGYSPPAAVKAFFDSILSALSPS